MFVLGPEKLKIEDNIIEVVDLKMQIRSQRLFNLVMLGVNSICVKLNYCQ